MFQRSSSSNSQRMDTEQLQPFEIQETPSQSRTFSSIFFKYIRPCFAEFFATKLFVFLDVCSPFGWWDLYIYVALVAATYNISGGHINPAVSLTLTLCRHFDPLLLLFYIPSQVLGGMAGAGLAKVALNKQDYTRHKGDISMLQPDVDIGQAILAEALATSVLVLVVLMVASDERNRSVLGPLAIGFAYGGARLAIHYITKTSLNPASSFAAAVVSGHWKNHYVFWIGPVLGSIYSSVVYCLFLASPNKLWIAVHEPVN